MPSPFPGMDPYLERPGQWPSFHVNFIVGMAQHLVPRVGDKYQPYSEPTLYIHEPPASRRFLGKGDAGVVIGAGGGNGRVPGGAALAEPAARLELGEVVTEERQHHIEVRTREDERVVTVIELLSPTNKDEETGRLQFLAKREKLRRAGVHFLQIDLLRGGRRLLPEGADPGGRHHNALLARGGEAEADLWYWGLRDRLPTLPVPLESPDPDATLDLQAVFEKVYDASGYGPRLYRLDPDPPLAGEDAAWAAGLVAEAR